VIRVLLADDQALIRAGFRVLLEAAGDIQVIGEAVNGEQAVELARAERPDVILMDIRMPGTDGLAATRLVAADDTLSGTKIVILTTFETDEYIYQALRAGASGFLVKDAEPEELIRAVRVAHRGEALLSPSVTRRLIASLATRVPAGPLAGETAVAGGSALPGGSPVAGGSALAGGSPVAERNPMPGGNPAAETVGRGQGNRTLSAAGLARLTEREREVLALVAQGLSNEELAGHLYLSPLTTKTHVSHIMTKLGARDRAQLVVIAYESGLVVPGTTPALRGAARWPGLVGVVSYWLPVIRAC
jgi:DNA-binding NarL/FixJ family response regulator